MGYLKDVHSNKDTQAFPGAEFEIAGEVPESQCSETRLEGINGLTRGAPFKDLLNAPIFEGWNLIGKICHIITNPGGNTGDFDIIANSPNHLDFAQDPGFGDPTDFYISNGSTLILTRDLKSFAQFIHAAGYAYTIKGGKLYTDIPSAQLQTACTILFDPLT